MYPHVGRWKMDKPEVYEMLKSVAGVSEGHCGSPECLTCDMRVEALKNLKIALSESSPTLMALLSSTANIYDHALTTIEEKKDRDIFSFSFVLGSVAALCTYRADAEDIKNTLNNARKVSLCSSKTLN